MKEVDLKAPEITALHRLLKLSKRITKSQLLHTRLSAEFWQEFQRNHNYKQFNLDIENGIMYELEFKDQIRRPA